MAFNPLALLRTVSRFGLVAAGIGSAAALGAGALLHDAAPASAAGCTVSADEAAFFADAGYGGACLTVGYGNYDAPYIYPTIGNDTMTSLQVGGNARTIVYMHNAYPGANQGTTGSFWSNVTDLSPYGLNDTVSSVRVEKRIGSDNAPRGTLDTQQGTAMFDQNHAVVDHGLLYRFDYYAGSPNTFYFLVADTNFTIQWMSPAISGATGQGHYDSPSLIPVHPGWHVGIFWPGASAIPFNGGGANSRFTGTIGTPGVGSTLNATGVSSRNYAYGTGLLPVAVPVVTAPANQNAVATVAATFNLGSFTDADGGPWSVSVDWGDSTSSSLSAAGAGNLGSLGHTYATTGAKTVTVKVIDTTGTPGSAQFTVAVVAPNSPPTLTAAGANTGNTVYYVDWTAANAGAGTASGVITLPDSSQVSLTFQAVAPDGSPRPYAFAQTNGGTNYWIPSSPYISTEVPNAPPDPDILALSGGDSTIYRVTLSRPIRDPIMAIVSLGSGGNYTTYDFDSPFTIVSQGAGYWGGDATRLVQLPGDILRGNEGHGAIKFLGTFSTFSWTVPTNENWHGFTFAIRATETLDLTPNEGQTATNHGTWGDPDAGDTVTLTASAGSVTKIADGTWTWSMVTTDGPTQSQDITVTATDSHGAATSRTFTLLVKNVPPTITGVTHAGAVMQGAPLLVTVTATDPAGAADPLQYEFDCTNDGTFEIGPQASTTAPCVYTSGGSKTLRVRVSDGDGGEAVATSQVTVITPQPPVVTISGPASVNEGDTATLTFSVADPNAGDTFTVNGGYPTCGGSGSLVAGSLSVSASGGSFQCLYPDGPANPAVQVQVHDNTSLESNVGQYQFVVNNVAPTVALAGATTANEGDTVPYTFTVADPGQDAFITNAVVNGSFEQPAIGFGTFSVFGAIPGWTTVAGCGVEIQNHVAGNPAAGTGDQFAELASNCPSYIQQSIATQPGAMYTLSLLYTPRPGVGNNPIRLWWNGGVVADLNGVGGGATNWVRYTYTVTAAGAASILGVQDTQGGGSVGGYVDDITLVAGAGPNCGSAGQLVAGSFTISGASGSFLCRFADGPATSVVSLQGGDSDGAPSNTATVSVIVNNVAPTITLNGPSTVAAGANGLYLFTVTDPGQDTFAASAGFPDCGAGGSLMAGSLSTTATGGSFRCQFSIAGNVVVRLQVSDSDGAPSNIATATTAVIAPPTVTATVTGTQGNNGWYTSDIAVSWTVTPNNTPVTNTTGCGVSNVTTDTAGVTFTCAADSAAGSTTQSVTVKRDASKPMITGSASTPSGSYTAGAWTNLDVTVSFTCEEAGPSGLDTNTVAGSTVSSTTASASNTGGCTDQAGNVAETASFGPISIDKVKPVITASASTASGLYTAGVWTNQDVTVTFSCTDAGGSGIATTTLTGSTLSGEGAGQTVTNGGACTDGAGNAADPVTFGPINIDKTAPTIAGSRTPAGNANGWNNSDVTVTFTCADEPAGSGVAQCGPTPQVLSAEGAAQSATGTAKDNAGNIASTTVSGINIDKTAPVTTATQTPPANGAGWNNTNVSVTLACTDNLSGCDGAEYSVNGGAYTAYAAAIALSADGVYVINYRSKDKAGNQETATTLTVKVDKTPAALYNQFDPATKDVQVFARDGGSGVPAGPLTPVSVTTAKWGDGDDGDDDHNWNDKWDGDSKTKTQDDKNTKDNKDDKGGNKDDNGKGGDRDHDGNPIKVEVRTYTVTDAAGNTTTLVEKVKKSGHEIKVTMVSVQYNGGPVVTLPKNSKHFEWSTNKDGTLKELEQKMTVGSGKNRQEVEAKFEGDKNRTKIHAKQSGPDVETTKPGLDLLRLVTDGTGLKIEY